MNLEEFFDDYHDNSDFLYHYFAQNPERILNNNYLYYDDKINIDNLIKLAEIALQNINYDILNRLCGSFAKLAWPDATKGLLDKIYELIKLGKLDVDKLDPYIKNQYYRQNPLRAIDKDTNNISYIGKVDREEFVYIIDRLNSLKYEFTNNNQVFLSENVFNSIDNYIYFINNAKYDADIWLKIEKNISNFTSEELHRAYNDCTNKVFKNIVRKKFNHNNYDLNSIILSEDIYLYYNNNKEQIMNFLRDMQNKSFNGEIVLQMPRIDMNIIEEAYGIVGDKLKISPVINQNRNSSFSINEVDDTLPRYDIDYIKKSERTLDLYASTVKDVKDKDGEIKSLSPLEKYAAAYLMVTKFAPYKKGDLSDNEDVSRAVYEFINSTGNMKIVCAGYANLLLEILYRMGIKDTAYWAVVGEDKTKDYNDHARIMIHLNDPKYGINGIYMADPTWDSHTRDGNRRFEHMLMSHDELLQVDHYGNVTLEGLHADDTIEMSKKLNVDDAYSMFRKPIPKEALIKANLALDRFLNKEDKMSKDGNYSALEYYEMANKMGFEDEKKDPSFDELIRMPRNDLKAYLEINHDLRLSFAGDLQEKLSEYFNSRGINIPFKVSLNFVSIKVDKNSPLFNSLIADGRFPFVDDKIPKFIIHRFDDLSIFESLPLIEQKLIEYQELVDNLSRNNEDNIVK